MVKAIALFLVLSVAAGGGAAGYVLRPAPLEGGGVEADPVAQPTDDAVATFRNGFIVPVLRNGRVWSHVILTLGVASSTTPEDIIAEREPILRDGMTEALFLHGSLGGFDGDFTEANALKRLRDRLDGVLQARLGDPTARVLIVSMARQST